MTTTAGPPTFAAMKTFDDEAARSILEKAAELEKARTEGLTLEELEAIGAEAGIDPALVRAAAAARQQTALVPTTSTSGRRERVLAHRVSDDDVDWIVKRAQDRYRAVGSVTEVGSRTTWQSHGGASRYVAVTVTRGTESTAITIDEQRAPLWAGAMALGGLAAVLAGVVLVSVAPASVAPVALLPLVGAGFLARSTQRRRDAQHQALLSELADE